MDDFKIQVSSEIGTLRCLLIHSPDSGLGKVAPSKAQDWLFEDIVHLETIRRNEYDYYVKILMYFLDPDKIKGRLHEVDSPDRSFFIPENPKFHNSSKVIELQTLLSDILSKSDICKKLVASVCAIEGCTYRLQQELVNTPSKELAKIFISGAMPDGHMIFAPIPNFIFTRDIGITVNNYILLNKPAKTARSREALLARYIFFNHPLFENYRNNIIEIPDTIQYFLRPGEENIEKTTLEGGDVMVVSKDHILIGCSERTSSAGASEAVKLLFENNAVTKATIIKIPHKRDFMHIDTIFTQVSRNTWALLDSITAPEMGVKLEILDHLTLKKNKERPEIIQFRKDDLQNPKKFDSIQSLLADICKTDLGCNEDVKFIYSGNKEFPYVSREQWTDSCNLLAIKEGVVLGYDRNDKTIESFKENGFAVVRAEDLLRKFEANEISPDDVKNTIILIPSAELSRARGGFHCMSMPLFREDLD